VPVLLDLGGERAAARHVDARVGELGERAWHHREQAAPVDRGVAPHRGRIEQDAVLDEQQRVDDQRRHRFEAGVDALGKARLEHGHAVTVEQRPASLGALLIDREDAPLDGRQVALGKACLPLDAIAPVVELVDVARQVGVAEADVVRTRRREADARARPAAELEIKLPGNLAEHGGLQPERFALGGYDERHG
jgi:hypothetical protein